MAQTTQDASFGPSETATHFLHIRPYHGTTLVPFVVAVAAAAAAAAVAVTVLVVVVKPCLLLVVSKNM